MAGQTEKKSPSTLEECSTTRFISEQQAEEIGERLKVEHKEILDLLADS